MVTQYGLSEVRKYAAIMQASCIDNLVKLGIEPSLYTKSHSWAIWDMAKQRYYYDHPEETV